MSAELNLKVSVYVAFIVTRYILEQQELEKKKNSKSRKKRKQNTDEEEGKFWFKTINICDSLSI